MFSMCESMKWAHLPNAGGLYEQDPDLLAGFQYIFGQRAEEQERQHAAEEAKNKNRNSGGRRTAGHR